MGLCNNIICAKDEIANFIILLNVLPAFWFVMNNDSTHGFSLCSVFNNFDSTLVSASLASIDVNGQLNHKIEQCKEFVNCHHFCMMDKHSRQQILTQKSPYNTTLTVHQFQRKWRKIKCMPFELGADKTRRPRSSPSKNLTANSSRHRLIQIYVKLSKEPLCGQWCQWLWKKHARMIDFTNVLWTRINPRDLGLQNRLLMLW